MENVTYKRKEEVLKPKAQIAIFWEATDEMKDFPSSMNVGFVYNLPFT